MKGDFSQQRFDPTADYTGVLYQQGRVFLDQDGNAADAIGRHLRALLASDTIGPGVVAVPAEHPDALQVLQATSDGNEVQIGLLPGRAWVDGLHLHLAPDAAAAVTRVAEYLGPPVDSPTPSAADIAAGVRDAVVLEVWEEGLSAFQLPERLMEPGLSGPDTTERVVLRHRLRLLRLRPGEDCGDIADRLDHDPSALGRLTVTPAPTLGLGGDCPVSLGGGYTGFEHFLYRIEIAPPGPGGAARFRYSRYNGGLVGRGVLNAAGDELLIRANDQMINLCGLTQFHLEVLTPGPADDPGRWWSVMTADATLADDGRLSLGNIDGAWPGAHSDETFFRLWDDIRAIADFPTGLAQPVELENGIQLAFDAPAADLGNYRPGDYWTFPVRAVGVDFDPSVWPSNAPPTGVVYHRAPLAVLNWDAGPVAQLAGSPAIQDCRRVFHPLTRLRDCCTFTVGDGIRSSGDFERIQDAVNALPAAGGQVCVLPGRYEERIVIDRDDVRIVGCGERSLFVSDANGPAPVFHIAARSRVRIESLAIDAGDQDVGVLVAPLQDGGGLASDIVLRDLDIHGGADAALKVLGARRLTLRDCRIRMRDLPGPWHAVYLLAREALVEHNTLVVAPRQRFEAAGIGVQSGRGGLHLAGTCEQVRVVDNLIQGGVGNGITLGSVEAVEDDLIISRHPGWVVGRFDPCDPCGRGGVRIPPESADPDEPEYRSAGALYGIRIERNQILDMGLAAIGVVGFFDLEAADELISVVALDILGNSMRRCLRRPLEPIPNDMRAAMGYGAVALADAEGLRLYDNVIEDNGPDQQYPVCGVFVLHGEGVDICRNRILNTGARANAELEDALPGPRGGIFIAYAVPGVVPLAVGLAGPGANTVGPPGDTLAADLNRSSLRPRQSGEPAARIHDNIVSQPLGQALALQALGPVSVQDNLLTSRGVISRISEPGFWACAVLIVNLGWSNEFYLQTLGFSGATGDPFEPAYVPEGGGDFIPTPQEGLDDYGVGQYMANGNVLFHGNQVVTDLTESAVAFAVSSVLLLSLDDVSVQDNQLDCDFFIDLLFTNLLAAGMSLRVNNNRFKESLIYAPFSSIGLGLLFNNTSHNQATHCLLHLRSPLGVWIPTFSPSRVMEPNQVLLEGLAQFNGQCERFAKRWESVLIGSGQLPQGGGPDAGGQPFFVATDNHG